MDKRMTLHLTYTPNREILDRLDRWDTASRRDAVLAPDNWRMFVMWEAARDASVSGSTGIEGNPLTPAQVEEVLGGAAIGEQLEQQRAVATSTAQAAQIAATATAPSTVP